MIIMQNKPTVIGLELQTIIYVKILSQRSKIIKQNEDIFFESKQDGDLSEEEVYTLRSSIRRRIRSCC